MQLLTPEFGLLIWTLVAFLIFFWIMAKFAFPAITKGLKAREEGIASSLAAAEKVKAEMAQLKSENEVLLAKAREERASILKEAKETSDKMVADAKEKAKTEFDRILTDAQNTIEQHKNAAIVDVKNMIGKLVIEVTEKVIRREMVNKKDHEEYILKLADSLTNASDRGRN
jgi:F-type H+-transporting ATPase subunit b